MIEEMGGSLGYQPGPGRGSTFTVRLPAGRPGPVAAAAPVGAGQGAAS